MVRGQLLWIWKLVSNRIGLRKNHGGLLLLWFMRVFRSGLWRFEHFTSICI